MEKSCLGKEGHPPSRVNFSERLYEKKVNLFARANSVRACSDCLALTELTRLGEPKCLYEEKLTRLGGYVTLPWKKGDPAWLAQGSSGRRVTLLAGTTLFSPYKRGLRESGMWKT